MKQKVVLLVLFFMANTLYAQKTTEEKIERTGQQVETVVGTVNAIKGLFSGGKKKKADAENKTTEKGKTSVKEAYVLKSETLNHAVIAKLVFDKKEAQEFLWQPHASDKIDQITLDNLLSDDGLLHTEIGEIFSLGDSYTALLITYMYTKDDDGKLRKTGSRAFGAGIGFANFIKDQSGIWRLNAVQKLVDRLGSDGQLPEERSVTKLGDKLTALSFTHGYSMYGESETHRDFYCLDPQYLGKKVFSVQLLAGNDGGGNPKKAYQLTKDFKVLPTEANEEYPRITVTEKNGKTVKSTILYSFSKEKGEYIGKTATAAKTATSTKAKTTPAVTKAAAKPASVPKTVPVKEPVRAKATTGW